MSAKRLLMVALVAVLAVVLVADDSFAGRRVKTFGSGPTKSDEDAKPKGKNGDLKSFAELTKDKVAVEGLFTFYHDTTDNSWLMAIKGDQFGPTYLCGITRSASAGAFYDYSAMGRTFPFYFQRVGNQMMMMEPNLRFRADSTAALSRSLERAVSDHLVASGKVISQPQDSTEAVLVKADEFFLTDVSNIGYFLGQRAKTGLKMDRSNSYFEQVKSFPENSEIDVRLHYNTNKPISSNTMQNPYSLFHVYHFSLSTIPESDYVPRLADERIGHFLTLYQDYTNLDTETPYVRYVQRWNLKKKDPEAELSEPVEPIVFWIENTTPEEYRPAIAEAIEFWNPAFEKIGFKNVMVAKQMPDTATWDPADARYNVIRWMVLPGSAYAVGPSRANPFTGQIYDADVRFSSDWIRYMYNYVERFVEPVSFDGHMLLEPELPLLEHDHTHGCIPGCTYAAEAAEQAAFGMAYLSSAYNDLADKDSLLQHYVHTYLREIIAHEVGHTLGFRHNFKASTIYTLEQVNDPDWVKDHSTAGTIMDYLPPNIAGPDRPQGEYFAPLPGPFDDWMVEYAYSDFGAETPEEEWPELQQIAAKAGDPYLVYGTDEDALGWSTRSVDPYANLHDQGADPLAYAEHRVKLSRELWFNQMDRFEKPGNRYQDVYNAFVQGWRPYREVALIASKYVGGLFHSNHHVGDPNGKLPLEVVPAAEQRRAVAMLRDLLWAPDAFDLPADLLNKLQPERFPDFQWTVGRRPVDFPIHEQVLWIQRSALDRLYSPNIVGRLLNNLERFGPDDEKYTMYDMFTEVRRAIWTEIVGPNEVNSFRRQLQMVHLNKVIGIYLSGPALYPADARTLAANDLAILKRAATSAASAGNLDEMSRAHYKEVVRQIEAAEAADREFAG